MPFFVFEKLLFDFYVQKNQNILTFPNIRIKKCAKSPAPNMRFSASGAVSRPKVCADLEVLRPSERQ